MPFRRISMLATFAVMASLLAIIPLGASAASIVDVGTNRQQTTNAVTCGSAPDRISELQDNGSKFGVADPFTVEGVVIFDGQASGQWDGFYIQDPVGDGNPATSDGIYVYDPSPLLLEVAVGDYVQVTGTVSEFAQTFSLVTPAAVSSTTETRLTATAVELCDSTATVTPTLITLPFASLNAQEQYEGMLVTINQTLAVTELFTLGRYGEVSLSLNARLVQPSNYLTPGAAAQAQQALNDRSRILIDDGRKTQNIDPIIFPAPGLSAANTLRHGDTTTSVTGVFTQANSRFGNGTATNTNPFRYRINTTAQVNFTHSNPRPASAPSVGGTLTVASMNLLNYFNTFAGCFQGSVVIDPGTGEPTPGAVTYTNSNCRGASNSAEFNRQRAKTIAAILEVDAAVLGINELENDIPNDNGVNGVTTAIEDLVAGLNAATAPGTYAYIDTGRLGTDAIRVGMIYQTALVSPVGAFATLGNVQPFNRNTRPALAQTFEEIASGEQFTMVANHFKSKGSCPVPADFHYTNPVYGENYDTGDGQSCWNADRQLAAVELADWLATNPTGTSDPDYLILGDLNSYAAEEPISYLTSNGYTNLIAQYVGAGDEAYSYVFDGQSGYLDHALANAAMLDQVTGAAEYHINADEPSVLDYNTEFKSAGQVTSLYAADEFRISDHDPVMVGLDLSTAALSADLSITKTDGVTTVTAGGSVTYTITASNAGPDAAVGATVVDTLPAALTGTWTCIAAGGGTCTAGGAGNINDTVNLPVGGSVTYTVSATISPAASGNLSNTATVSSTTSDPNPANNSATDVDTILAASTATSTVTSTPTATATRTTTATTTRTTTATATRTTTATATATRTTTATATRTTIATATVTRTPTATVKPNNYRLFLPMVMSSKAPDHKLWRSVRVPRADESSL